MGNLSLVLSAIVLLAISTPSEGASGGLIKAKPVTIGNCSCDGLEIKDGSTQREFRMNCKKEEGTGKKKKTVWHTSCITGGDPHPCAKYNKKQQNFYDGLLSSMASDYCAQTTLASKKCFETKAYHSNTICQEIAYTFNRYP